MSERVKICPACGLDIYRTDAKAPAGMSDAELIASAIRAHAVTITDFASAIGPAFDLVDAELARREKERQT